MTRPDWTNEALPVDLHESGLLWLINRVVFHPRGYSLGMAYTGDSVGRAYPGDRTFSGFVLDGDGSEPNWFEPEEEAELFAAVERTFAAARRKAETR